MRSHPGPCLWTRSGGRNYQQVQLLHCGDQVPLDHVLQGRNLTQEKCNKINKSVDLSLRGAGTGGLGLTIEGASEAKISCKDNKDGSCSVEYIPFTPGDYDVNINYGGHPIPGSPFRVPVKDPVDPSKVKCSGPGLGAGVRAHVPQTFTVDSTKAGQAPLDVKLYGPSGEDMLFKGTWSTV